MRDKRNPKDVCGEATVRGVYQCEMTETKRVETFFSENTHQEGRSVKRVIFRFSRLEPL